MLHHTPLLLSAAVHHSTSSRVDGSTPLPTLIYSALIYSTIIECIAPPTSVRIEWSGLHCASSKVESSTPHLISP